MRSRTVAILLPLPVIAAMRIASRGDRVDRVYGLIGVVGFIDNRSAGFE